jgi:DNA helicase-2/ATP-dependent DNA helicase PcrA
VSCLAGAGVVDVWAPQPEGDTGNPGAEVVSRAEWPADPLGGRRPAMAAAADLIRRLMIAPTPADLAALAALPVPNSAAESGLGPAAESGVESEVEIEPDTGDVRGTEDVEGADHAEDAEGVGGPEDEVIARWRREADLLLAERDERAHRDGPLEVALPGHLSVSQLVVLRRDPIALARSLRRPMPSRPTPYARRGTAFHAWLEQRYGAVRLLDVDELPGAADADAAADEELAALQEAFLAGEWADRTPVDVEVPFATTIGGVVIRGRMDAVFAEPGGRFDVIDWKTGRRPTGAEAGAAAVQLAAYRMAWASLADVPPERVRAGFYYVRDRVTVRPPDLPDVATLFALVTGVPEASPRRH